MPDSMQDQLRKAGLVNDKKLRKAQRVKHAAEMERKTHGATADDPVVAAQTRTRRKSGTRPRAERRTRSDRPTLKALQRAGASIDRTESPATRRRRDSRSTSSTAAP